VYFTHWILALIDSLPAFVILCRRYVMMYIVTQDFRPRNKLRFRRSR